MATEMARDDYDYYDDGDDDGDNDNDGNDCDVFLKLKKSLVPTSSLFSQLPLS